MERFATVRDWLNWAIQGGPEFLPFEDLPGEILACPLDVDVMMFRVKCFTAVAALHQSFLDAAPDAQNRDHFRYLMDEMDNLHIMGNDCFANVTPQTWNALRTLKHECDNCRHLFSPHSPGSFYRIEADWLPDQTYGDNMLHIRGGTIIEKLDHEEEDADWLWVVTYNDHPHRQPPVPGLPLFPWMTGWVPKRWLRLVPCWHNIRYLAGEAAHSAPP
jgi:hypothetical protein